MPPACPRSSHILAEDPLARAINADLLCFGFDGLRVEVPIGRPGVRPRHSAGAARLLPAPAAMNNNQVTERALRNVFSVPKYITFGSKECVARHAAAGAGRRRGSAARGVRCPAGDTGKKNKWEGGERARCGASARHPLARGMPAPAPMPHHADLRGERPVKRRRRGGRGARKPPARAARERVRARVRGFVFIRFWWGGASAGSGAFSAAPLALRSRGQPREGNALAARVGRSARDVARGARHYP